MPKNHCATSKIVIAIRLQGAEKSADIPASPASHYTLYIVYVKKLRTLCVLGDTICLNSNMDLEKVSALGPDKTPDTSRMEQARLDKLSQLAQKFKMSLEDLNSLKVDYVRDHTGPDAYPVKVSGKVNGVQIVIEKRGEPNKRTFYAELNGKQTNDEDAYKLWSINEAAWKRDEINEKAKSDILDTLSNDDELADLEYENEIGLLRDKVLGGK